MKFPLRSCLLPLALVTPCAHAAAPDPALVGCWRAVKIVLHAQDGTRTEDGSGRCRLQFGDDTMESTCRTGSGMVKTTYQYRIDRPGFYLATMTASTFGTSLVGTTREYEYHVAGDQLVTVTRPAAAPAAPANSAARVESEAVRTPCP